MEFGVLFDYLFRVGREKNKVKLKCSNFLVNFISRESLILLIKLRVLFVLLGN